jgi:tRNA G46 methylase TrmB
VSYEVRNFQIAHVQAPENALPLVWPLELNHSPLDLEIGCGVGWHPIWYATENPQRRLIAIEHTRAKFASFAQRLRSHQQPQTLASGLTNLQAVHADAIRWVSHFVRPESVDRCWILYPNPEPKAVNKRWMRSPFMHQLLKVLKPGGEIHIATNDQSYISEAIEWAEKAWSLEVFLRTSFDQTTFKSPRTHFEKKYLLRGETCFEAGFRKLAEPPTPAVRELS